MRVMSNHIRAVKFSDVKTKYKPPKKKDAGKVGEEAGKYGNQGKMEL